MLGATRTTRASSACGDHALELAAADDSLVHEYRLDRPDRHMKVASGGFHVVGIGPILAQGTQGGSRRGTAYSARRRAGTSAARSSQSKEDLGGLHRTRKCRQEPCRSRTGEKAAGSCSAIRGASPRARRADAGRTLRRAAPAGSSRPRRSQPHRSGRGYAEARLGSRGGRAVAARHLLPIATVRARTRRRPLSRPPVPGSSSGLRSSARLRSLVPAQLPRRRVA